MFFFFFSEIAINVSDELIRLNLARRVRNKELALNYSEVSFATLIVSIHHFIAITELFTISKLWIWFQNALISLSVGCKVPGKQTEYAGKDSLDREAKCCVTATKPFRTVGKKFTTLAKWRPCESVFSTR